MKRVVFPLLMVLVAPALLAPVRLRDATPGFFEPLSTSPAPESYSLPAAEPLAMVSPTVIAVSPTLLMPSPTDVSMSWGGIVGVSPTVSVSAVVTGTLNLPLPPSPTAVVTPTAVKAVVPVKVAGGMSETQGALCLQALDLTQEMAMLSYQQKQARGVMALSIAASLAMREVENLNWPVMAGFKDAAGEIPMFQPQKAELKDAAQAALRLCVDPAGVPNKVSVPRPE